MDHAWSVFNRDGRLVAVIEAGRGEFHFARSEPDAPGPVCPFATVRCFDAAAEGAILAATRTATSAVDLATLLTAGYVVIAGPPKPRRFARL